jgi:hypothetical protein
VEQARDRSADDTRLGAPSPSADPRQRSARADGDARQCSNDSSGSRAPPCPHGASLSGLMELITGVLARHTGQIWAPPLAESGTAGGMLTSWQRDTPAAPTRPRPWQQQASVFDLGAQLASSSERAGLAGRPIETMIGALERQCVGPLLVLSRQPQGQPDQESGVSHCQ